MVEEIGMNDINIVIKTDKQDVDGMNQGGYIVFDKYLLML